MKIKKPVSFASEHTVEYSLIRKLDDLLIGKTYAFVFPSLNREGNTISNALHSNDRFQIIGIFPRRPKVVMESDDLIYFKINSEIIDIAKIGETNKIPFLGGCPYSNNLWNLGKNISWLHLKYIEKETVFSININDKSYSSQVSDKYFLSDEELLQHINTSSKYFSITEAIQVIREIKEESNFRFNRGPWGSQYKPFYVFIKSD